MVNDTIKIPEAPGIKEILESGLYEHVLYIHHPLSGDKFEFGAENVLKQRLQKICNILEASAQRFSDYSVQLMTFGEALDQLDFDEIKDPKITYHS